MNTYLLINIFTISIPLILSFDKKVAFYKMWKYYLPAIFITAFLFIIWDVYFTKIGVWGFNDLHLTGIHIFNLPLEECLFFITVPYASVFTYEVIIVYIKKDLFAPASRLISVCFLFVFFAIGFIFIDRLYTAVTFISTFAFLVLLYATRFTNFLGRFYFSYLIILFPFFIVNGVLTGTGIEEEVVFYNNAENLGLRLISIPVEDSIYGMLLILMNVSLKEFFRRVY